MSNAVFVKAKNAFLKGQVNWLSDTIRVVLINKALYVPDLINQEFLNSIPSAARVATSAPLTGKTVNNGAISAANLVISAVTGQVDSFIIYADTGDADSSRLLVYFDSSQGIPVLMDNGSFNIQWNTGVSKIMSL